MEPLIALTIDRPPDDSPGLDAGLVGASGERRFAVGDTLRIEYQIDAVAPDHIQATEASVLWFTEGKGEPDMGVHFFRRTMRDEHLDSDLRPMRRIDVPLPVSPLSYDGVILRIRWCVRIRLFLKGGREFVEEQDFLLGTVPPATAVSDNGEANGVVAEGEAQSRTSGDQPQSATDTPVQT